MDDQIAREILHELREIRDLLSSREAGESQPTKAPVGWTTTPIPGKRGVTRYRARHFLRAQLLDGPLTWGEIVTRGDEFGHKEHTLRRARGLVADLIYPGGDSPPVWKLKEEVRHDGA